MQFDETCVTPPQKHGPAPTRVCLIASRTERKSSNVTRQATAVTGEDQPRRGGGLGVKVWLFVDPPAASRKEASKQGTK